VKSKSHPTTDLTRLEKESIELARRGVHTVGDLLALLGKAPRAKRLRERLEGALGTRSTRTASQTPKDAFEEGAER
jgi:hypothetical protein